MTGFSKLVYLIRLWITSKVDSEKGKFRALDDIFEEVINELRGTCFVSNDRTSADTAASTEAIDETMIVDIWALSAMPCVQIAMRNLCEFKGLLFRQLATF